MPILSEKKLCYNIWYLHAFRGERDHFWPLVLFSINVLQFHFGGETAWLGAPDVASRCVWTVSYSSELECILENFLFPPRVQHNCLPVNA